MTCVMLGVLVRAGYEIHRAEDARRMATRRSANPAANTKEPDRAAAELPLAARTRIEPRFGEVNA
jgi:cell division protein FtsW